MSAASGRCGAASQLEKIDMLDFAEFVAINKFDRKGAAGHDICFIHPKGNEEFPLCGEGVLIELVQAPAGVVAGL